MKEIKVVRNESPKNKPNGDSLGFGKYFTDHMLVMEYSVDLGWHEPVIIPYGHIALDPSAMVFHYGQEVFEGMKAYKTTDGHVCLFRPDANMRRLNQSSERISIPQVDEELLLDAIIALVREDQDWIPDGPESSLYIRPFIIATEPGLGVRAAHQYKLMVIMSPSGSYYPEGIHPVSIFVENQYVRAVRGGTGTAKTAGNYASGIKAQEIAQQQGYSQVLWLDGVEKKYIEEVGSMNVFFKIAGEIVTPELSGSILAGITRDSVIRLLQSWGHQVTERRVSVEELFAASKAGTLEEAFGTGTAAVISPIGKMKWDKEEITISGGHTGEISKKLYDTITGIQKGVLEDRFGWRKVIL